MKSDSPISEKKDDLLDRYEFGQDIVKGILHSFSNGQPSLAIGINGEWGGGKSSLLEFMKKEIEIQTQTESTKTILFDFNPWVFSGQIELQTTFLIQLGLHLRAINPELEKLGDDISFLASLLEIPNSFNPDFTSRVAIGSTFKGVQKIIKRMSKKPTLIQLKNKIDEELEDTKIKVFIFIDDIDRLIPSEVLEILRLVKLNANFKNTFFILAYDKSVIVKAISSEIKIDGERFLEKIVQIDYTLPKVTNDKLEEIFLANLDCLRQELNFSFDRKQFGRLWNYGWKSGLNGYYSNLRNIYRFINSFSIRYNSISEDINVIDFIAIESIRLFDLPIYEWIFDHKNELVHGRDNALDMMLQTEKKSFYDQLIENPTLAALNVKDNAIRIISSIFNSIHLPELNIGMEPIDELQTEKDKRIVHPDYFDHYFTFKISDRNIPQSIISAFLIADSSKQEKILDEYKNSLFKVMLTRIMFSISPNKVDQQFFKFFLDYSDSRNLEDSELGQYRYNGLFLIITMLIDICKQYGFEYLYNEMTICIDSYSRFYLLSNLQNRVGKKTNFGFVKDIPDELLSGKEAKIQQSYKKTVGIISVRYLNSPFTYKPFRINEFLRILSEYDISKYRRYISKYFKDDDKSILLFICSLTVITGESTSYFIQNEKYILPEINIEKLDERLSKISIEKYESHNKEYLALFYKLKSIGFAKYRAFTIDLEEVRI